ncbi:unnamed protein product [Dovyalis caffra]|uniref:DNA replication complex GINS protein PSF2 n=1 Tax=Dovyalis caffra TaxID=77055 RepID=A0AAV1QYK8_9ROSI|nr:unnamed protein product [Dovyalis caffra]
MAGQSDSMMSLFSPEEIEFMAEDELVEIVPNLRMDSLNFLCGDYGPFYPQLAAQVPLWLALALKKRGNAQLGLLNGCQLVLEAERDFHAFQPLPFHYVEISRLIFDHAREDIPDMYMVRSLIEDIRDVRFHKVETNLEKFTASTVTAQGDTDNRDILVYLLALANVWKNMSAMEVNIIRAFSGRALQAFYKHDNEQQTSDTDRTLDKQPQIPTDRPKIEKCISAVVNDGPAVSAMLIKHTNYKLYDGQGRGPPGCPTSTNRAYLLKSIQLAWNQNLGPGMWMGIESILNNSVIRSPDQPPPPPPPRARGKQGFQRCSRVKAEDQELVEKRGLRNDRDLSSAKHY